jgi:putative flippase GtrA
MTSRDLGTLLRSFLAGAAATLADLAVLGTCVAILGMSPRLASLPALVAGGVVNFFGNRHFAFRARSGSLRRQAILYAVTELVALALNGLLYDAVVRNVHPNAIGAMIVRLITTHVVFVAFSYPIWRKVFRPLPA